MLRALALLVPEDSDVKAPGRTGHERPAAVLNPAPVTGAAFTVSTSLRRLCDGPCRAGTENSACGLLAHRQSE